jgi:hypothetical protein
MHVYIVAIGIAIVGILLITVIGLRFAPDESLSGKAAAFDRFCMATLISVQSDIAALESTDPTRRAEALDREFRDHVYYGDTSLRICLGDQAFDLIDVDHWCRIAEDYKCVAEQRRAYKIALERR